MLSEWMLDHSRIRLFTCCCSLSGAARRRPLRRGWRSPCSGPCTSRCISGNIGLLLRDCEVKKVQEQGQNQGFSIYTRPWTKPKNFSLFSKYDLHQRKHIQTTHLIRWAKGCPRWRNALFKTFVSHFLKNHAMMIDFIRLPSLVATHRQNLLHVGEGDLRLHRPHQLVLLRRRHRLQRVRVHFVNALRFGMRYCQKFKNSWILFWFACI